MNSFDFSGDALRSALLRCLGWAVMLCAAGVGRADAPEGERKQLEFFEKLIRPVLVEHCYECHSSQAKTLRAGLRVDTRAGLRAGGETGPAVVPGKPKESLLLEALRYESYEMPPQQKLPSKVIQDFETWIANGAVDPREGKAGGTASRIDIEAGRRFWSFRPLTHPKPPDVKRTRWPRSAIDRFLLAAMEERHLTPAGDADRRTLIRRLMYDLIGLPPRPEEIAAFLDDPAEDEIALNRLVDRLLASPHFGERWGRHWLDVARFSQSTGGGRSMLYGQAWRYRDYVIEAFNRDKPFDLFVQEQLAGDLMPARDYRERQRQIIATAFLELGPTNYELQDKVQLQMDVVDEQIDTMGRAFLGMTLGCARCHDHKFDPIPMTDYYALAGIFKSTHSLIDGNVARWVTQPLPGPPELESARQAHREQLQQRQASLTDLQKQLQTMRGRLQQHKIVQDETEAKRIGDWTASKSVSGYVGQGYHHARDGKSYVEYSFEIDPGRYEVRVTYTAASNRSPNALIIVKHANGESETRIDQRQAPEIDGQAVSIGEFALDQRPVVTVSTVGASGIVIADAVELVRLDNSAPSAELRALQEEIASLTKRLSTAKADLEELKKSAPPEAPQVVCVEDADQVGDAAICVRGVARQLGETVPRGVLQVATLGEAPAIPEESSGRLQLARWIASPDHPLTARVYVNRVWQHLFGEGLVRTVDHFGQSGERPSHPELLDYLASSFIQDGWSTKRLVRRIVLSRAYRMQSRPLPAALAVDPENRLLCYQRGRRLEAEALYDAILALSGTLETSAGGPSVRPDTKSEYGYQFDHRRRAVYLPVFRNRLPELFSVFDFPDPNLSIGRRTRTTLATQALFLMNSPFVIEQSEQAARRLLEESSDDLARLDLLYERALGRLPTSTERAMAREFLARGDSSPTRWALLCQAVICSLDFRFVE